MTARRSARQQGCRHRQREWTGATFDFAQIGTALTLPSYTILTYTGSWTGSPTATNLPAGYHVDTVSIPGQVNLMVPKPSTLILLALGLIGAASCVWRRR